MSRYNPRACVQIFDRQINRPTHVFLVTITKLQSVIKNSFKMKEKNIYSFAFYI